MGLVIIRLFTVTHWTKATLISKVVFFYITKELIEDDHVIRPSEIEAKLVTSEALD